MGGTIIRGIQKVVDLFTSVAISAVYLLHVMSLVIRLTPYMSTANQRVNFSFNSTVCPEMHDPSEWM